MEERDPLNEICNQRLPRRRRLEQTYGKRKGTNIAAQYAQKALFGKDENEIEDSLAALSINSPPETVQHQATSHTKEHGVSKSVGSNTASARKARTSPERSANTKLSTCGPSLKDLKALQPLLDLTDTPVERFTAFGSKVAKSCSVTKIGEGSFAEVFKLTPLAVPHSSQTSKRRIPECSIVKIIPLAHPTSALSAADRVSTIDSVAREISLLSHLNSLHGFTTFSSLRIVYGAWPKAFLHSFDTFRQHHKKRAINPSPEKDFDDQQIYALVEMGDAGSELALLKKPSAFAAWDVFWSVVVMLANAEDKTEFEHRDLHLSNICVKFRGSSVMEKDLIYNEEEPEARLDISPESLASIDTMPESRLGLSGLRVTIIDYTVSRARFSPATFKTHELSKSTPTTPNNTRVDEEVVYDPMHFISSPADPTTDIEAANQMATYQKCRVLAQYKSLPQQDKWRAFHPETNTIWLGYLLHTMLNRARGRTGKLHMLTLPPAAAAATQQPSTKNKTPSSSSLSRSSTITKKKRLIKQLQTSMWDVLEAVESAINGDEYRYTRSPPNNNNSESESHQATTPINRWTKDQLNSLPRGAKALLEQSIHNSWLGVKELEAFKERLEEDGEEDD